MLPHAADSDTLATTLSSKLPRLAGPHKGCLVFRFSRSPFHGFVSSMELVCKGCSRSSDLIWAFGTLHSHVCHLHPTRVQGFNLQILLHRLPFNHQHQFLMH